MSTIGTLIIILIHIPAIVDASRNLRKRQGWLRMTLAIFPPFIGPVIYFLTRNSYEKNVNRKNFMEGKRRFT
jgi:hypothetical protein